MRIRGFPFGAAVRAFLEAHKTVVVVEQNRDGQLRTLLTLETPVPKEKLRSVLAYGGYPLSAEDVVDGVIKALEA
jgi:2-oxoglutarate ferredoxin oxidoreductase subunit alpha